MKKRDHVLAMVCALMTILMLDRVCLSVAGPRMQAALHIGPAASRFHPQETFAMKSPMPG
jgi:hypothetical protein